MYIQKINKKGEKVGKPKFAGYTITFSAAMNQGTLTNARRFCDGNSLQLPSRKPEKVPPRSSKPVRFSKPHTSNTVTLKPAGNPFAKNTGQIVVSTAVKAPPERS